MLAQIGKFQLFCRTEQEIKGIYRDIFLEEECAFTPENTTPYIIDAGAHLGLATLYFKQHFPHCEIVCFEPNPQTFSLLQQTIELNSLTNVRTVNAALSDYVGETYLYGVMGEEFSDTRGNSIMPQWGERGKLTKAQTVNTIKLSLYVDKIVDFLKLDVEGAEYTVLRELEVANKLKFIKEIDVELHLTNTTPVSEHEILTLLQRNNFSVDIIKRRNLAHSLPEKWKNWVSKNQPTLTVVRAVNKVFAKGAVGDHLVEVEAA